MRAEKPLLFVENKSFFQDGLHLGNDVGTVGLALGDCYDGHGLVQKMRTKAWPRKKLCAQMSKIRKGWHINDPKPQDPMRDHTDPGGT